MSLSSFVLSQGRRLLLNKRKLDISKSETNCYNDKKHESEEIIMEDRYQLNKELAQMLKGGVIMDVTTPEQAVIAQEAGACAVMALERIPADIRAAGGVSRMSDPAMIRSIQEAVTIPVMAKCRIGHFVEAQILEAIEIDYIDEQSTVRLRCERSRRSSAPYCRGCFDDTH